MYVSQETRRKRKQNRYILDEAEATDGSDEEDDIEPELEVQPEDDEAFQVGLPQSREHQGTLETPSIFSDLITRLESSANLPKPPELESSSTSVPEPSTLRSSSVVIRRPSSSNEPDALADDDKRLSVFRIVERILHQHPDTPNLLSKYLVYLIRCRASFILIDGFICLRIICAARRRESHCPKNTGGYSQIR